MNLRFLGTRGEIEARNRRHMMHSSLLIEHPPGGRRIIIDWGKDWAAPGRSGMLKRLRPHAIVITHAHPDHAWGLKKGCECPVFATAEAWREMRSYAIDPTNRRIIKARVPATIGGIRFEAFPVEHSIRCPAVCYRVCAGGADGASGACFVYAPDVVEIHDWQAALRGIDVYIADGASPSRALVRKRGNRIIGHASIRTQLQWCSEARVPRAIFTHCGSPIVAGDERRIAALIRAWGREHKVDARIAHDGMEVNLVAKRTRRGSRT